MKNYVFVMRKKMRQVLTLQTNQLQTPLPTSCMLGLQPWKLIINDYNVIQGDISHCSFCEFFFLNHAANLGTYKGILVGSHCFES